MSKIIQLSDTHIVDRGQRAYDVVDTVAALERAVATIRRLPALVGSVDAVVVTGDLTDFGSSSEYALFREIMAPVGIPLAVVPGNHDRRETMRQAFSDLPSMPQDGPINWLLDLEDMAIIGLDTLVEGASHGELAAETLAWLGATLSQLDAKPLVVAMHHHPFETRIGHMDKQGLRNGGALFEALSGRDSPVSLICGHVHRMISTVHAGMAITIAPSPSHAVALDHRPDGPANLMMEPGGLLLHTVRPAVLGEPSHSIVTEVIPVGIFDGPYPFFPE